MWHLHSELNNNIFKGRIKKAGFRWNVPVIHVWAWTQENLSAGFDNNENTNQSAHSHSLGKAFFFALWNVSFSHTRSGFALLLSMWDNSN